MDAPHQHMACKMANGPNRSQAEAMSSANAQPPASSSYFARHDQNPKDDPNAEEMYYSEYDEEEEEEGEEEEEEEEEEASYEYVYEYEDENGQMREEKVDRILEVSERHEIDSAYYQGVESRLSVRGLNEKGS